MAHLPPVSWARLLVRSGIRFFRDDGLDLAAALTYWSLLGVFPAGIVVVSLTGLVITDETVITTILEVIGEAAPADAAAFVEARLREVTGARTAAGVLLSFGALGSLWTASLYLRSFTRAANNIYQVSETRPFYRLLPRQLMLTVVALVLIAAVVIGLVVGGPVARAAGQLLGVEQAAVMVWDVVRWPALLLTAGLLLTLLFWVAPDVRQPRLRWLAVGGMVTLAVWGLASAGFAFYVANLGAYDLTYGALGTAIVFLVWLFLTNCAIILGVEVNAELRRRASVGPAGDPTAG